ncbi:efflux RND transporter periplasmic adaptor subunit [Glaciecola sp. XM2]|uniref:efflux RND transporter periplasmic adaptor subunit n=1 Tax=Glaciecola sp. XM2 TaxID=1914931 RepID=UPI001BDE97C7|nr:efflux RND transporter periplasmic adaptor subunit [Glaciecola sp. XM2]MBT1450237.1 efflux RND transporter periplasmic adaptor subunit [Glaciecola sp. XM2]
MSVFSVRLISFSLFAALLLSSFSSLAQFRGGDRPRLVSVEPLSFEYESTLIEAVGSAQAKRSVTLFPSVADEVTAVNFVPGQNVAKGDILVELDSRLQDVDIERAQIQLVDAQRNLERVKASLARGAVTERELDDADTAAKLAKVALQEAKENKEDRLIRAPFDGVVGFTDVEVGDRVTAQTEVTTIDDRRELFVNFVAPELAVTYLMEKPDVQLQPWTDRTVSLQAKIGELDSRVNLQDRTIRVRALLDNTNDQYRPGMSFRVSLAVRGERYVAVPEAALSWGASGAYVWLAQDDKAKRVDVQVKQRMRGRILVSGDLRDGESLIVEGIQSLRAGQPLTYPDNGAMMSKKADEPRIAG